MLYTLYIRIVIITIMMFYLGKEGHPSTPTMYLSRIGQDRYTPDYGILGHGTLKVQKSIQDGYQFNLDHSEMSNHEAVSVTTRINPDLQTIRIRALEIDGDLMQLLGHRIIYRNKDFIISVSRFVHAWLRFSVFINIDMLLKVI